MSKKAMGEIDFNRLSRNELYRLATIVVYAMRRLNKRLNEEEIKILTKRRSR